MNYKDVLQKLGIRVRYVEQSEMPDSNIAGYYDTFSNDITLLNDMGQVQFDAGPLTGDKMNYVAMHELIHWEMHQDPGERVVLSLLSHDNPKQDSAMEEIAAEAGAEKLEKDFFHLDNMRFIAERINSDIIAVRPQLPPIPQALKNDPRMKELLPRLQKRLGKGMPAALINDAIARGISAAEEIEEKMKEKKSA